jgi:hypothetical protein
VSVCKVMVYDHSFCAAIEKGGGTDFFVGSLSDKGYSERDRRRSNIMNSSFRYRLRVKGV